MLLSLLLAAGQLLDLQQGTLTYTVVHKLHEVKGVSRQLEGKALLPEGAGPVKVQVRAKVASFDSGNGNRDEHVREVTHEALHPYVSVKGTLPALAVPLAGPQDAVLHATVEFNGEKKEMDLTLKLQPAEGGAVRATFSFPLSLEAFHVERPELLLVKVDDKLLIEGDLIFGAAK
jgi:hypothetical protein